MTRVSPRPGRMRGGPTARWLSGRGPGGRSAVTPAAILMPGGIVAAVACRSALAASGTAGAVALPAADAGFTLIEALVAMAVLAVAAAGFLRATQGHVDTVAALETRAAGGWAADAALTEARLGLTPAPTADVLGRTWRVGVATTRSNDPDVAALTMTATAAGVGASLRGFRDLGPRAGTAAATGTATAAGAMAGATAAPGPAR